MPPKYTVVEKDIFGIVKWYNATEKCGRITIDQYGEVFVHFSRIIIGVEGKKLLKPSERVKCDIVRGPKGIQADNVEVIKSTAGRNKRSTSKGPNTRQRHPSDESTCSTSTAGGDGYQVMPATDISELKVVENDLRGEVMNYNRKRGFGFIMVRQYGSIFCHVSRIIFSGLNATEPGLEPTQIVKCDVARDGGGQLSAINVHVISDASKPDSGATAGSPEPAPKGKKNKKSKPAADKTTERQDDKGDDAKKDGSGGGIIAVNQLGEVVAYNAKKKYGFIKVQGYDTVFVHQNGLMRASELNKNQVVKCDITKGPKTLMALNVSVVGEANSGSQAAASAPPVAPPLPPPPPPPHAFPQQQFQQSHPYPPHYPPPPGGPPVINAPPLPVNPQYPYPAGVQQQMPMGPGYGYGYGHNAPAYPQSRPDAFPPPYQEAVPDLMKLHLSKADAQPVTVKEPTESTKAKKKKPKDKKPPVKQEETEKSDPCKTVPSKQKLNCEICEDVLEDPVTTPCEHLFCRECINEWLAFNPTCPVDGKAISKKAVKPAPQYVRALLEC